MKKILLSAIIAFAMNVSAQVQNTLQFDGTNDYINAGVQSGLLMTSTMSLEAWVYPEGTGSGGTFGGIIANREGEYEIARYSNGYLAWAFANTNPGYAWHQTPAFLPLNQWSHVALTYQSGIVIIYLNGELVETYNGSGSIGDFFPAMNDFWAGGRQYPDNHQYFHGKIDELKIWNIVRTQSQIRDNEYREHPNPSSAPGLVLYYRFNQSSGNLVSDYSSSGYNGTLVNMDPATDWVVSTAPIPYYSITNGDWNINGTWAEGQNAPQKAWSRVQVKNAVNLTASFVTEELTIDPSSSLTVNSGIFFTVNSAITNNGGNSGLVIKADDTGRGSLINGVAGVTGTMETYLTPNMWHFISSPVSGETSGLFTGYYLQYHQESDNTYYDIIPTNVTLNVMQGYALWSGIANTFSYAGDFNTGSHSFGLTRQNQGWNLTGNPYPSSIDWDAASGWTKTNINNAIYVENNGGWSTYIAGVGTNGGTRFVAPGQGFFVECNTDPGLLAMTDAVRVHGNTVFFKNEISDMVRLQASGNDLTDETVIRFVEEATDEFDGIYDAHKLSSGNENLPELFSINGGGELSINALPHTDAVQLGFRSQQHGTFTISATEFIDISTMILEDLKEGIYTNLSQNNYSFDYVAGEAVNRFVLHFSPLATDEFTIDNSEIYAAGHEVYFNLMSGEKGQVSVFNLLGQEIISTTIYKKNSKIRIEESGIYIIRMTMEGNSVTRKVNIY